MGIIHPGTIYEHQPDFPTVEIAARPDNDQADSEPLILSATCVCGLTKAWEASVRAGRSTGWLQTTRHLKFGQTTKQDKEDTLRI